LKKSIALVLVLCICMLMLPACSGGSPAAGGTAGTSTAAGSSPDKAAPVVVKLGHIASSDMSDPQQVGAYALKEKLEELSGGYYQVDIYPSGQLGDSRTMLESVQMGTLEMQEIENGACSGFVTETMLWDLPYLIKSLDHAEAVFNSGIGDNEREKFLDIGVRILAFDHGGFRYFTNNARPIVTPADMKGLKMRVMESEIMIATVNAFGGNAVPMAFSELYSALQQGTVDGQDNPASSTYNNSFQDVQKYLSLSGHFYFPRRYVVSESFYQAQSPEHQKMIEEAAAYAAGAQNDAYVNTNDQFIEKLKAAGMEVNEVDKDAFAAISEQVIWPQFYAKLGNGDEAAGKALVQSVLELDPEK